MQVMTNSSSKQTKTLSMLNIIGLKESINSLMKRESKYIPVASLCKAYLKKLNDGAPEEALCEAFVTELAKVAVHESAKTVMCDINSKINIYKRDLGVINALYEMKGTSHGYVFPMVEGAVVEYLINKCPDTRQNARKVLSLFEGVAEVNSVLEAFSFDEYEEKTGHKLINSTLNEEMLPKEEKTYTEAEVAEIVKSKTAAAIKENEEAKLVNKTIASVDTHINLHGMIKNLISKEGKNEGLKSFCEQYVAALNSGKSDEILYESFVSGLSRWNYLNAVDTELSALKERISKYGQEIDLKKILETMNQTTSYYLVPLIEELVVDYINNKNVATRTVLRNRLQAFEYDPYVRDIINIIMKDDSISSNVCLGESIESCNGYVHTEKIFSPVKYIKENECIFNVKGTYYDRKGNSINKLSESSVAALDESFKRLCNLINHPAVEIDGDANTISVFEGKDCAKVSETEININGEKVTTDELNSLVENAQKLYDNRLGFYRAVQMINENFDNIAYIDFVKRAALNESNGKTVDVFRIKDNLFVTTTDVNLGQSTFYRNVNPIQCRNYINEHLSINAAPMFNDILPNQSAILEDIDETKKAYENYIEELDKKKEMLLSMREESDDEDIDAAIALIDDERNNVIAAYKKYQDESDEYIKGEDKDKDVDSVDNVANDIDGLDNDIPAETPAEMEQPIEDTVPADPMVQDEIDNMTAEDKMIASATPYDSILDTADDKLTAQVLRVSYDENVKSGVKRSEGQVFIVVPSVNANGDVQDEVKTVRFYLDPSDRKPVLNNEYMPLSLYKTIIQAINDDPDTATVEINQAHSEDTEDALAQDTDIPAEGEGDSVIFPEEPVEAPEDSMEVSDPSTDVDVAALTEPVRTPSEEEPMAGLDADPDIPADAETEPSEPSVEPSEEIPASEEPAVDSTEELPVETPAETPVESPKVETPAETANKEDEPVYPMELGLSITDIKPIRKDKFEDDLDDLGIEHSEVEGVADAVDIKIKSKSDAYALRDYFKEWKNYSPAEFINFFPELKACFENKPKVPVMPLESAQASPKNESVQILGVESINESRLYNDNSKGCVNIVLPYTEDYAKIFGYSTDKKTPSHIQIITENAKETRELYKKLSTYAKSAGIKLDEDAKQFLDRYADDFKAINEETSYTLSVPFNGFLAQKLSTKGIAFSEIDENMNITLNNADFSKAKKLFEGFYGDAAPISVKDFFQFYKKSLNEGIKITIRDDKSGKTVELDTDGIDDDKSDDSFANSFKDTTFDVKDSALYTADDDSSDESDKDEEKDDKKTEETKEEPVGTTVDDASTGEEPSDKSEEEPEKSDEEKEENSDKEEPKKKRFTFRKKVHESAELNNANTTEVLNESAEAKAENINIYDYVKVGSSEDSPIGYVISKLPMSDNFIVNVGGHTIECKPSDLHLVYNKADNVEFPVKFDKETLKALSEQMVQCGMFMHDNRLTPNDCYVKYSEYAAAGDDEPVKLVVEGQVTMVSKKYVKIVEDFNEFLNPADYAEGEEIADGQAIRAILYNVNDYAKAINDIDPVRVLVDVDGERRLVSLPLNAINPIKK